MDKELPCDFYFGDSRPEKIEPFDVSLLKNFKSYLHNINIGPFYWQKGALRLLKSDYTDIVTPGDINCLSTWLILFLAKRYKKRIFTWTHGGYGKESYLRKFIIKFRAKRISGIFLYGNYAKSILMKYGVDPYKMYVIYNSLAYDEQIQLRDSIQPSLIYQEHFKNNNRNIIFVGRLTKVKKLDQVLKAVEQLSKEGVFVNVTFIGDGLEKEMLQKQAEKYGLNNVWFYGACYIERTLSELIYNADLCVSPGNVGLTAMHAMTFGTPVISHNNFPMQMPEFEAIEEGLTGGFFIEDNIDSLANSIKNWFNTQTDREKVRNACYKVIDEKYNPHVQIRVLKEALYR